MQPVSPHADRYDRRTIAFHWITAFLVVFQWLGAQTIDWFPRGSLRINARSVHITFGAVLAAILVGRLVWRLTGGRRLPSADRGLMNVAAKATHWSLYALLLAMVSVGIFLTWTRGDSLFNLIKLPVYEQGNHQLKYQVQEVHATIGWIIVGMAGLHGTAGLIHRYLWHDAILSRMLPSHDS